MPDWVATAIVIAVFVVVLVVYGLIQSRSGEAGSRTFASCHECADEESCALKGVCEKKDSGGDGSRST